MVRLVERPPSQKSLVVLRFNSTMVRLVGLLTVVGLCDFEQFQFHYGTIGSAIIINRSVLNLFQFHYGTIGSWSELPSQYCLLPFQFHYGTIGSFNVPGSGIALVVSIPLWYDW